MSPDTLRDLHVYIGLALIAVGVWSLAGVVAFVPVGVGLFYLGESRRPKE